MAGERCSVRRGAHRGRPYKSSLEDHAKKFAAADLDQCFIARLRSHFKLDVADSFVVHPNAALRDEPLRLSHRSGETFSGQQLDQPDRARRLLDGVNIGGPLTVAEQLIELATRFLCFSLRM